MSFSVLPELVLFIDHSGAFSIAVLAIATWFVNHSFVLDVATNNLETAASLKAVELAVSLDLIYTSGLYLTASEALQEALESYNNGSDTSASNWIRSAAVLTAALSSLGPFKHAPGLQSQVFSRNLSGPAGNRSVLNVTGAGADVTLPWSNSAGTTVRLGDVDGGYPAALYPNITVDDASGFFRATYNGISITPGNGLILGPLVIFP